MILNQAHKGDKSIEMEKMIEDQYADEVNQNNYLHSGGGHSIEASPTQQPLNKVQRKENDSNHNFKDTSQDSQSLQQDLSQTLRNQKSTKNLLNDLVNSSQSKKNWKNGIGSSALTKRKIYRITLLFLFEIIVVALFLSFYYKFGYFRGEYEFSDNENLKMNLQSCILKINDYSDDVLKNNDLNFLSTSNVPSEINKNILLQYTYPSNVVYGDKSSFSYEEENGVKTLSFINEREFLDCEIAMYIYKQTTINSLIIDCGRIDCFIIVRSKKLKFKKISASGYSIDFNASFLDVEDLAINSFFGQVELNNINFTKADIDMSTGDIAIQSTKSIEADLEMVEKLYCASSYSNVAITNTITDVSPNCTPIYPFGTKTKTEENIVAFRCLKGKVTVKSQGGEANQILSAKNTFGNIFINVIEKEGDSASKYTNKQFDSTIYGTEGDKIDLSKKSKDNLNKQLTNAENPNVYDPIFQIVVGSKYTQSSTYSQWHVTYNPAYSYLKPWWLGSLTITLLTTQFYYEEITISPGFCPYVPSLSEERIYKIQELLKSLIVKDLDNRRILTFGWQEKIDLPSLKLDSGFYDGIKNINFNSNYLDRWMQFYKEQDETIHVRSLDLDNKQILLASIVISFILAVIVGIVFMIAIVYIINQNYLQTLDHMKHVDTYASIQKIKSDTIRNQYLYEEIIQNNENDNQDQEQNEVVDSQFNRITNSEDQQIKYTVTGLFKLFQTLVYLSPPLSAYIDQVFLLFYKANTDSAQSFFKLLFAEEKKIDDEQIHNLEKDSISGQEMKTYYDLLERKLDNEQSVRLLRQRGFRINIKQGTLVSYYTYVMYKGNQKIIQDSNDTNSLGLFIKYCCKLTNFDSDSIDSLSFEQNYFVKQFLTKI